MLKVLEIKVTEGHKTITDDNRGEGSIECNCGNTYIFSLRKSENMVNCNDFTYPRCPKCLEVPYSDTRQIDL